jgi:ketosteroid isomerase-like protein
MRRLDLRNVALAVLLGSACAPRTVPAAGPERERLEQRQAAFFDAMLARDADRTAAFFADDAVLHIAGMPAIGGRAAVRAFYGNMFGFLAETAAVPGALDLSAAGDMAYGYGSTRNTFSGPQGSSTYAGKYVLVWRRIGGDWRILLYAVSSDAADAGRD